MSDEEQTSFGEVTDEERNLALMMHLLALFVGFLGPLIIWLLKKAESPFIDQHGKEALNFQISVLIYSLGAGLIIMLPLLLLSFVTMGLGLVVFFPVGGGVVVLLVVFVWVGCILAALQASRGETCKYPLTISFVK